MPLEVERKKHLFTGFISYTLLLSILPHLTINLTTKKKKMAELGIKYPLCRKSLYIMAYQWPDLTYSTVECQFWVLEKYEWRGTYCKIHAFPFHKGVGYRLRFQVVINWCDIFIV